MQLMHAAAATAWGNQAERLRRNVWRYVDGLTDDELHWEPAPGMWGLRLKTEVRTDRTAEEMWPGNYFLDCFRDTDDSVAPFTTIGWRLAHVVIVTWNWNVVLTGVEEPPEPPLPGDAESLVALWREVLDAFVDAVTGFTDDELEVITSTDLPRTSVVAHVTVEIACHSAEIGTLRHLKRSLNG